MSHFGALRATASARARRRLSAGDQPLRGTELCRVYLVLPIRGCRKVFRAYRISGWEESRSTDATILWATARCDQITFLEELLIRSTLPRTPAISELLYG